MKIVEVHGQSLKDQREKERESAVHHLRIYAHVDGDPDSPAWLVQEHHSEDDPRPKEFEFRDGAKLSDHIRLAASIPGAHSDNDSLGRTILPKPSDLAGANLTGRARTR